MYYVYVIRSSKNSKMYKGFTSDLRRRVAEHNNSKVVSTKAMAPWVLIYYEAFINKTAALKEEIFLKSGRGKQRLKYLLEGT